MIYPLSDLMHFVQPMAARGLKITASVVALCCLCLSMSQAKNTLRPGEDLGGSQTLVSSNEMFELGIFSSGNLSSGNHYLGIWFKNDPQKKAVWVGNRENPILDSSGVLTIRYDGNLVLTDRRLIPIIVNSAVLASSSNTTATLLDSGNLVLKEGENVVWQSFYYPSDTFLPGMRLGWSGMGTEHGSEQFLVSWQSPLVPATGSIALGLYKNNKTQLKVWHRDGFSQEIGFWDGQRFRFLIEISLDDYNFTYVTNPQEVYLALSRRKNYTSWFVIASTGEIQEYKMVGQEISMVNRSICDDSATVTAIDCYRMTLPSCKEGNKFSEVKGLMPDSGFILETVHLGLSDCEIRCKSNCSCTAFASYHDDGTGCKFYYGDKSALRDNVGKANETIYIRGDILKKSDRKAKRFWWIAVIPIVAIVLPVITLIFYFRRRKHCCKKLELKCNEDSMRGNIEQFLSQLDTIAAAAAADTAKNKEKTEGRKKNGHELPLLNFSSIERATNYFSEENKLGEGGFGPVYKALLLGHEVAVKRLSAKSGQGLEEFKNELQSISKLQHRNLVRLLGCCIEGEEKILIYEYLANKSLDIFLFDPEKKALLDWNRRVCIIEGIAQGLLYLHKYSRLRIIHRDLKTGNILLDDQMNPKISDFGMARIFGDNEAQAKTTRVVGTYGYMSPEYAVHGLFSIKSDVFSFGVIILEVISGRKSSTFYHPDFSLNILVHAWDLWKGGHGLEFVDPALANSFSISEFLMCMQVALLCVQESPRDRPTMSEVVSMLSNESTNLPVPRQPAFSASSSYSSPGMQVACSSGNVTFSDIEAR